MPYYIAPFTILYHIIQYFTLQYYTIQKYTILYCVLYDMILSCTILSACLSVCRSVCLSVCPSVYLFIGFVYTVCLLSRPFAPTSRTSLPGRISSGPEKRKRVFFLFVLWAAPLANHTMLQVWEILLDSFPEGNAIDVESPAKLKRWNCPCDKARECLSLT